LEKSYIGFCFIYQSVGKGDLYPYARLEITSLKDSSICGGSNILKNSLKSYEKFCQTSDISQVFEVNDIFTRMDASTDFKVAIGRVFILSNLEPHLLNIGKICHCGNQANSLL